MSLLRQVYLSDLCEITSSQRVFLKDYRESGVPFYRSKEIINKANRQSVVTELFISEDHYNDLLNRRGVPKNGDLLLTSVGTIGIPYLVGDEKFYFKDGNLTWFKNFSEKLDSKYLYYWIISAVGKSKIDSIKIGSTQPAITIKGLKNLIIDLPAIEKQQEIAEILSSLDDKIELNNKINTELEKLAQAIYKQWFVDFEFPDENGNPYKSSGGEMIESELGMIPKGWRVGGLGEEFNIQMGQSPKGETLNEEGDGMVFYQGRSDFGFRIPSIRMYTNKPNRIANRFDTIMSVRAPVGDINMAHVSCCIGRGIASISHEKNMYGYTYNKMLFIQPLIKAFDNEGTVFGSINRDSLNKLTTIIPDLHISSMFDNDFWSLDMKIFNQSLENLDLVKMRDLLINKLIK